MSKSKNKYYIFSALAFMSVLVSCHYFSTNEAMKHQKEYCKLVKLYESQVNVEPVDRTGHPNYNGINCERLNDE